MKSKLVILLFALVSVFILFNEDKEDHNQFQSDRCGYYIYLPAVFIYHDPEHLLFYQTIDSTYNHSLDLRYSLYNVNGKKLNKYPVGVSFFEAPFFFIAHAYCKITGQYPADGFTMPYQLGALFSTIFWVIFGLAVLRRFLKRYFSESITALAILCIAFGTNLFAYTAFEGEMSHVYVFFLFACLINLTDTWYAKPPQKITSMLFGLTLGLIFIVRPVDIIVFVIPLFWKVSNYISLKERIGYLRRHYKQILIVFLFLFLIALIQFSYWKVITGHWLYYSYQGEGFDFLHPNIIMGLFSYRKGWFLYTPMAIAGFAGFYCLWKRDKKMAPVLILFFFLMIYAVFSWREWWYGCGFGCRPLVESLAILSLPLAAITENFYIIANRLIKMTYFTLIVFVIALNVFQTYQYSMGLLNCDRMTKEYYWHIFGQTDAKRDNYKKYLINENDQDSMGD